MAATFKPVDAFTYAKFMIKNMPLDTVQLAILQSASNRIWMEAPWRWSIANTTPITLSTGDYRHALTFPASFLRFEKCYISDGTTYRPLTIVGSNSITPNLEQFPTTCSADVTNNFVYFDTEFPALASGDSYNFYAWYKKIAPLLATTMSTNGALIMDDEWFWVYQEAVLYYAYKYADDQRAGGATGALESSGKIQIQYTGQLGVLQAAIEQMRKSEPMLMAFPETNPNPIKDR